MIIGQTMQSPKGFEQWLINGHAYNDTDKPAALIRGKRYQFAFRNNSDDFTSTVAVLSWCVSMATSHGYSEGCFRDKAVRYSRSGLGPNRIRPDARPLSPAVSHGFRFQDGIRRCLSDDDPGELLLKRVTNIVDNSH
jgi:hypothetical protein